VLKTNLQKILALLLTVSLIPAVILGVQRVQFESNYQTVGVVMDYIDTVKQARENGMREQDLFAHYKSLGVNGFALYENALVKLVQQDKVVYRDGSAWRNERLSLGKSVAGIESRNYYLRSLVPGTVGKFIAKYKYRYQPVNIDGVKWLSFSIDIGGLAAGPDTALITNLEKQGFFVVYRPFEESSLVDPGSDFPNVKYIVYAGDQVTGNSEIQKLEKVIARTKSKITGVIESVDQAGIVDIAKVNPVVRVFAIPAAWQAVLQPEEIASKFVLAARERNHRLLYVRPYQRIDDTDLYLNKIRDGLEKAKFTIGQPSALEFRQDQTLRKLALLGPILGLLLLATTMPWTILGALVTVGMLGLAFVFGNHSYGSMALLAACVFPALGFSLSREGAIDWFKATLVTLMGALFVSALGVDRNQVLALEPFSGVALTLVLPPALVALAMLPKRDIRQTIKGLWGIQLNLGTLVLIAIGIAAVALVVLRRGNTTSGSSISPTEAKVRAALQDSLIRPRTKEILLHPAALLGLSSGWPLWFSNILLLAGVIGQGSIIDSFAHYHTPMLITLLRTVNGLAIGFGISIVTVLVVQFAKRLFED
jgi:hypothetical protein